MVRRARTRRAASSGGAEPSTGLAPPRVLAQPVFSQPQPTADPTTFDVNHPSDDAAYKIIDELNKEHKLHALPFPRRAAGSSRA